MIPDYHIHSRLCKHAVGEAREYVETALARGLGEIGFADHCPYPAGFDPRYRMLPEELSDYRRIVDDVRGRFPRMRIRYGLEVDWVPGRMDEVFAKIAGEPFDYLIGSVHYTDEFPFDDPEIEDRWREEGLADKVWLRYMDLALEMVSSGRFSIIGHFDIPKKFGYFPSDKSVVREKMSGILDVAGKNGTAIEINTSGLRKPVKEIYPSLEILRMARESGVSITFGSDAHAPGEVGMDFDRALALARAAGYRDFALFEGGRVSILPLPA